MSIRVRNQPLAPLSQQLYHYFTTRWFVQAPPWPLAGLSDYIGLTSTDATPLPSVTSHHCAYVCSKPVYVSHLSPTH